MEHSELFLLFPKFEDVDSQPGYILSKGVMLEADYVKIIRDVDEVYSYIKNESYDGFYDVENLKAFLYPTEIVEESYPNIKNLMRMTMQKWGTDWRMQMKQKDTVNYMYYSLSIQDDSLCELTERKAMSQDDSTFLLVNADAMNCAGDFVRTMRNQSVMEVDVRKLDVKSISAWYEMNRRPQRVFHLNPKHGENGKGAHPEHHGDKVSVLMCSRAEANQILHKAIGEDDEVLFFFDTAHDQYIEFKKESANTYHAFHLDDEDRKRVPALIKSMIDKLV